MDFFGGLGGVTNKAGRKPAPGRQQDDRICPSKPSRHPLVAKEQQWGGKGRKMHFWELKKGFVTLTRPEDRYSSNKRERITKMASKKTKLVTDQDQDRLLGSTFRRLFLLIEDGSIERLSVSDFGKLPLQLSLLIDSTWTNINFGSVFQLVVDVQDIMEKESLEGDENEASF